MQFEPVKCFGEASTFDTVEIAKNYLRAYLKEYCLHTDYDAFITINHSDYSILQTYKGEPKAWLKVT